MYTMVLMMALNTGAVAPDGCFHRSNCNGCHGCYSSCAGSCHGCSSRSCHGCSGWSCSGCNGCACNGCHGGLLSRCFSSFKRSCHGCNGCHGGYACHGCTGCTSPVKQEEKKKEEGKKDEGKKTEASVNQAQVVVSLPADAKLFIDETPTTTTSAVRSFVTPELEAGKVYNYTLRAEIVRDGKPLSVTKEIAVRAGETTQAAITFPTVVASK